MGRTNKSRCEEDFNLMRRHIVQEAVLQARDSPMLRRARYQCGYFDREDASGPLGFGRWIDCMAPFCKRQSEATVSCLEQSGGNTAACEKHVLGLFRCSLQLSDRMHALDLYPIVKDKLDAM